jgi:hypothetical protein
MGRVLAVMSFVYPSPHTKASTGGKTHGVTPVKSKAPMTKTSRKALRQGPSHQAKHWFRLNAPFAQICGDSSRRILNCWKEANEHAMERWPDCGPFLNCRGD